MEQIQRKPHYSLFPVLLTYFLDNFGLAIIYPIFTPLFLQPQIGFFAEYTTFGHRTLLLGLLIAAFPIAQFFGAPLIGELSDRFGRKKAFFATILGTGIGYSLTSFAIVFNFLPLLFFSRIWTGFFAGNLTVCLAVVADVSQDDETRTRNFGWIGTIGGIGFILAILMGGTLSNPNLNASFNPSLPFLITSLLSLLNLGLMLILFKESHPTHPRGGLNFLRGVHHIMTVLKIKKLRMIYAIFFFFIMAWATSMQFLPTLLIENYGVSPENITWCYVGIGIIWAVSNLMINRLLAHISSPPKTLFICLILLTILLFATIFPKDLVTFLVFFALATFCGALSWTNSLATVSLSASEDVQGSVLGINQSIGAIGCIFGPSIAGIIAGESSHLVYLFTGISSLLAVVSLYFARKHLPHFKKHKS